MVNSPMSIKTTAHAVGIVDVDAGGTLPEDEPPGLVASQAEHFTASARSTCQGALPASRTMRARFRLLG